MPCANCVRRGHGNTCTYESDCRVSTDARRPGELASGQLQIPSTDVTSDSRIERGLPPPEERNDTNQSTLHLHSCEDLLQRPLQREEASIHGRTPNTTPGTFGLPSSSSVPLTQILENIPSRECCDYLITKFFAHVSPLFDVVHGPTFQRQYMEYLQAPTRVNLSWLALLFVICASALHTVENNDPVLARIEGRQNDNHPLDTLSWSRKLSASAFTCLAQDQFLFHHDLNTLEAILLSVYVICHSESVERGWVLLGVALNIGIALRCNREASKAGGIEEERRWRCWMGILMLHTYQGIVFRDIDMSFLLNTRSTVQPFQDHRGPNGDLVRSALDTMGRVPIMQYKLRLFELTSRICSHDWRDVRLQEDQLITFHTAIAREQQRWDQNFLVDGAPSVLDTASYAHWCVLQTYAHQLYLFIHQPFSRSRASCFRPESRAIYLKSSMSLLDLHQQLYETPRLRHYRWLLNGMTSFNAFQGAVAMASCLLDRPEMTERSECESALGRIIARMETLKESSLVCARVCPVLQDLWFVLNSTYYHVLNANSQRVHLAEHIEGPGPSENETDSFEQWIEQNDLPGADPSEWVSGNAVHRLWFYYTDYLYLRIRCCWKISSIELRSLPKDHCRHA